MWTPDRIDPRSLEWTVFSNSSKCITERSLLWCTDWGMNIRILRAESNLHGAPDLNGVRVMWGHKGKHRSSAHQKKLKRSLNGVAIYAFSPVKSWCSDLSYSLRGSASVMLWCYFLWFSKFLLLIKKWAPRVALGILYPLQYPEQCFDLLHPSSSTHAQTPELMRIISLCPGVRGERELRESSRR